MQALEALKRKIETAGDLQDIVKTMKALAAVSIRQYEKAVESLADYQRTIDLGLQAVLQHGEGALPVPRPTSDGCLGAVIFGSDQGLCGRFNDQIAYAALSHLHDLEPHAARRYVLAVGARVASRLEESDQPVEETFVVPGSIAGITPMVQNLLLKIETWRAQRHLDRVVLLHNRPLSAASYESHLVRLMPIDLPHLQDDTKRKWPSRSLPTFSMDRERLLSALIRQHFFVLLYRALAESLASENASRLASMQGAERNIEERLAELQGLFRYQRQHTITEELLDIVAGFEALRIA